MKLPLLVYAAREGYGWISGKDVPDREILRRLCGRMPDVSDGDVFSGVVLSGDTVVAYRFMLELQADSRGRNGTYLVLTRMSLAEARGGDFKRLFESSIFSNPVRHPPERIDLPDWQMMSGSFGDGMEALSGGDWRGVGATFAGFTQAELDEIESVRWSGSRDEGRIVCRIEKKEVRPLEFVPEEAEEFKVPSRFADLRQGVRIVINRFSVTQIVCVEVVLIVLVLFWNARYDLREMARRWLNDRGGTISGSTVEQQKQ